MKVIRGESVHETAILTSSGELLHSKKEGISDLIAEECRKAFQKGFEKGEKVGHQRALEESKTFLDLLQVIARKVLEQKERLLDQLKPEIIEFSMVVCEQVIRKELSQPQALVRLINTLLNLAHPELKNDPIHIILSPEDYLLLEEIFSHIQYDAQKLAEIQFKSDPLMRRGDCRIETKSALLNYDISRELSDLQTKVLQR